MKPDQQRVCDVVMETVIKLCASGLEGSTARVQGVIGVTVDESDVFVIHINDMVSNLSAGMMVAAPPSNCHMTPLPVSPAAVTSASPAPCSSARKRARHRLVFESPDVSRRSDLTEGYGGLRPACGEASHSKVVGTLSPLQPVNQTDYGNDIKQSTRVVHAHAPAAKSSVVVVDSDEEDVKLVADQRMTVLSPKHGAVCGAETLTNGAEGQNFVNPSNCADTACAADPVSNLCIADVVGSVTSWSLEQDASLPLATETLPTVIKDDLNSFQDDDDDVTVMDDVESETTQMYATATPPRQFQVIFELCQVC